MKIVLYCDKYLYRKLNMAFPKYNDDNEIIGSLFSEEEYDNYHILDRNFINLSLNPLDGIHDIYLLIIQKSWYADPTCINICKYMNVLHPEAHIVFYMDEPYTDHLYFSNRIVMENLAFLAHDPDELNTILQNGFGIEQSSYCLPKLSKGKLNKLKKQYMNS